MKTMNYTAGTRKRIIEGAYTFCFVAAFFFFQFDFFEFTQALFG